MRNSKNKGKPLSPRYQNNFFCTQIDAPISWKAHGSYLFKNFDDFITIGEVGIEGAAPFEPPPGNKKVQRAVTTLEEDTLGWRQPVCRFRAGPNGSSAPIWGPADLARSGWPPTRTPTPSMSLSFVFRPIASIERPTCKFAYLFNICSAQCFRGCSPHSTGAFK
jgi:hypothetical protein